MLSSLPKQERLHSFKEINELFKNGKSLFNFPFKLVYCTVQSNSASNSAVNGIPVQIMVSVPKRNFKRAVKRNLLKRRTRESYRLNKQLLADNPKQTSLQPSFFYLKDKKLNIMFIYVAKEELPYQTIEKAICNLLGKLRKELNEKD